VIVCCRLSLSTEDEKVVNQTTENAFSDHKKVYVSWFKNGKPAPREDEFIMLLRGSGWGGTNVSCQLNFRPFVSCQLNFRPFVSCQLIDC